MRTMSTTKVLLLASASPIALFGAGAANAADMAIKARPILAPPPPAYSWTGCYVGTQVGWGWGQQHYNQSSFESEDFGDRQRLNSSGGLFGGQVGCNYQFSGNWVAGIQGDIAGTDINGKGNDNTFGTGSGSSVGIKTDWLASVTARLGVTGMGVNGLVNGTLYYVKGGIAWDHNVWDLSNAIHAGLPVGIGGVRFGEPIASESRTGWTIGGGIETVLWAPNWTGFVEFNYYDFGKSKNIATSCNSDCDSAEDNVGVFQTGRQDIETVKIGVNYKFW